jgi:hypothetical protein
LCKLVDNSVGGLVDAQRDQILVQIMDVPEDYMRHKYGIPKVGEDDKLAGQNVGSAAAQAKAAQDLAVQQQKISADAQVQQAKHNADAAKAAGPKPAAGDDSSKETDNEDLQGEADADAEAKAAKEAAEAARAGMQDALEASDSELQAAAEDGHWITTETGRHVLIRDGETAGDAMKRTFGEKHSETPSAKPTAKKRGVKVSTNDKGEVVDGPKQMIGHSRAAAGEYYHGTSATNVDSILKNGIKPTDKTLGVKAAFVGQNKNLALSYGGGSAAANNSDDIAMVVVKHDGKGDLYSPKGATNIGYNPNGIRPEQIDRIEYYKRGGGKDEKPFKVVRPGQTANLKASRAVRFNYLEAADATPALAETIQPLLARLKAIDGITDKDARRLALQKFLKDYKSITEAMKHDDSVAKAVTPDAVAAFVTGLKSKPKTK